MVLYVIAYVFAAHRSMLSNKIELLCAHEEYKMERFIANKSYRMLVLNLAQRIL